MADWFTENAPDAPAAKTPPPPSIQPTLDLISKYESGNQNVPNYRFDPGHTAQGYYQITNTNWNQIAPVVGIDTSKYPTAMAAPRDVQAKVASYLLTQTPAGIHNWSDFNPRLRAALNAAPAAGEADRSAPPPETPSPVQPTPSPVKPTAAQAANGIDDILARIGRGENVNVTPEMIMQIAFGDTGRPAPPAVLPAPPAAAPVQPGDWFATNAPKPPPPPPQPPPQTLGHAWDVFTQSTPLQTLGGLSSAFPALAGRISGMPDYANEQRFKNTVSGLYQGIVNEPWRIGAELQKYSQAMLRGDVNEAADHLWFTIPFLGAAGAQMKEYLERRDYVGAAAHATGVLATAAVSTPEGRAAVAEAPSAVADVAAKVPEAVSNIPGAVANAAPAATRFVKAAAPDVGIGAAKIATGTAMAKVPVPEVLKFGTGLPLVGAGAKQVVAGLKKGLAAAREAPEAEAAAAAPEAAAAAATPGQTYAAAQGVDWGSLSATDRQAMEQIAQAHANMAQAAQSPRVVPPADAAQVFPDVSFGESPAPPAAPPLTPQDLTELTTGRPPSRQSAAAQQTAAETLATAQSAEAATSPAPTFLQTVLDRTRSFLSRMPGIDLPTFQGMLERVRSRLSAQSDLEETAAPRPAGRPPGPPGPPGQVMSRAQRRATVMPPEEGIPEQVARAQAEREAIIGKPRDQWTNADVLAADALRAEGYTGAPQLPSAPPAAGPAVPPALPPPATEPVPAATSPPVAPEPAAAAPATPPPPEAPAGALTGKPKAAVIAQQLEEMTRTNRIAEFLKANWGELTPEDIDKFDAHDWELIGKGAGGAAPTPEQIGEIRASAAGAAAPVPPEVSKMPPAQAEAAVAPKLRKPPASAPQTAAPPPPSAAPKSLAEMMAGIPERPELEKLDFAAVTRARNVERLYDTMKEAGITPEMADAEGDAGWAALAKKAKIGPKGKPYVPSQATRAQLRQRFAESGKTQ